ncbi:glycosyltransferase [Cyclobacteriaceae bacterium]|nr:glycosyltransferase [Cyclobacteriaceae bacterium]
MKYSVVIPVFNSAKSLLTLLAEITGYFQQIDFEVILVDDGSNFLETQKTLAKITELHSFAKIIVLRKNFGKAAALLCGFHHAKGDYIITIDDDGQHNPVDFKQLIEKQNHDVVIGKYISNKHGIHKRLLSKFKNTLEVFAYGKPYSITISPVKLINRDIIQEVLAIKSNKPFIASLLFSITSDIVNVPITHHKRTDGRSGFTLPKMWSIVANMLFNNSSILLKALSYISVFSIIGILLGWSSLFIWGVSTESTNLQFSIFLCSSTLLLAISILGEYLIRIISGIEQKKPYYVRAIVSKKD